VNIFNALIDNNSSGGAGGAAGIDSESDFLLLQNSTVADNHSTATGDNAGGIVLNATPGSNANSNITNSTIAGNTATGAAAGGIEVAPQATAILQDTLVATNQSAGTEPDVRGAVLSQGNNLIGQLTNGNDAPNLQNGMNGDQVGTAAQPIDPKLGPLQDNGGATFTLALASDSPAVDKGALQDGTDLAADQRGFQRVVGSAIDIGAFEFGPPPNLFGAAMTFTAGLGTTVTANQPLAAIAALRVAVTGSTSAVPGGFVDFSVDGQLVSRRPVSQGVAQLTLPGLTAGMHQVTAAYEGDGTFAPISMNETLTAVSPPPPGGGGGGATGGGGTTVVLPPLTGDVTSRVRTTLAAPPKTKKGKANKLTKTLTITNTSGQPLQGPLNVVLRGLKRKIKVKGAAGVVGSKKTAAPFVVIRPAGGTLAPGAVATITLSFSAKPNAFTLAVFAGTAPK
jgi:hypothetical protein